MTQADGNVCDGDASIHAVSTTHTAVIRTVKWGGAG